jgi:hypothetical protein
MCDYSLYELKNRIAKEGELIFINRFRTGSKGFASEADYQRAIGAQSAPNAPRLLSDIHRLCSELWQRVNPPALPEEVCADLPAICLPHRAMLEIIAPPVNPRNERSISDISSIIGRTVSLIRIPDESFRHRDAIVLDSDDNIRIPVQTLPLGLVVRVLSLNLSADKKSEEKPLQALAAGASQK